MPLPSHSKTFCKRRTSFCLGIGLMLIILSGALIAESGTANSHQRQLGVNREALVVNSRNDSVLASSVSLPQTWSITGDLNFARDSHTATLLSSGQVLVAGGRGSSFTIIRQTELYDPSTGSWVNTGDLNIARRSHTGILLGNGKVLVAGGIGDSGSVLNTAELYDPATGAWSNTGNLNFARERHTATLLTNGKVLVAGGLGGSFTSIASVELYDPATGTWSNTGNLNFPHERHTATLLPTGKVLVAGGNGASSTPISKAELYDAMTGSWSNTTDMNFARQLHTATLLANGKVLVAGGFNFGELNRAEVYDPASATWNNTGNLNFARFFHTATLLANGTILVAGGGVGNISTAINKAELYDPIIGSWSNTGILNLARELHTATLLPNGEVLVAGGVGGTAAPNPPTNKAELYTPPQSAASPFWTTYQHDSSRSGLSPFIGPLTNSAALLYDLSDGYGISAPVVGHTGMIYFTKRASNSGTWTLVALHSDGSFAFESSQYTGHPIRNLTIGEDGTIYVPTFGDYLLFALFPDGTQKWMKDFSPVTPDAPSGSPGTVAIGQDGTLYVPTTDGYFFNDWLVALYPEGTTKWGHNYGVNGALIPAVAPTGDIIVSKAQDRSVVAHNLATGHPLWETFLGADPGTISAPAIGPDGTIYVWFNRLWALSPGGHVKWSTALTNTSLGSTPAIAADGSILFATSDFSAGGAATLFSFSASGQPNWSVGLATGLGFATPQIALDAQGTAYVSFNSASPNPSSPLIFSVGNDGSLRWSFPAKIANTIIMGSPNTAYAALFDNTSPQGSDTWKIYSFSGSSPTPTPTPTPMPTPTPTPTPSPSPFPLQPNFKLPLPGGRDWLLSVEIGSPTTACKKGVGGRYYCGDPDCFHSGKGKYSLDFLNNTKQNGELEGKADVDILAAADGEVISVEKECDQGVTRCGGGFGNYVQIRHGNTGYTSFYGHLLKNSIPVSKGQSVKQGDKIGIMGTTGQSTGIHVHFEVRYKNQGEKESATLDLLVVDGRKITNYAVGTCVSPTYYLSTNTPTLERGSLEMFLELIDELECGKYLRKISFCFSSAIECQ